MAGSSAGEDSSPTPPVIVNTCLSFMRYLMLARDKSTISDMICSKFNLDSLKIAREVIFKYVEPKKHYGYHGPQGKKSQRELAMHAIGCIYDKLHLLDSSVEIPPIISCPSNELHMILSECPSVSAEARISALEVSHADLQKTVLAMMTAPVSNSAFQPDSFPSLVARNRSDSVRSKRLRSENSESEGEFNLPRDQFKKMEKKRKLFSSIAKNVVDGAPKDTPAKLNIANSRPLKRQFTWGKSVDDTVMGFSGQVPDAFIYRCTVDTKPDIIKSHLINKGIKVTNVELKSRETANTRSFKVSFESQADFDKVILGEFIPRNVRIRKFIHFSKFGGNKPGRGHAPVSQSAVNANTVNYSDVQSYSREINELDNLGNAVINNRALPSTTNSPHNIAAILQLSGKITSL